MLISAKASPKKWMPKYGSQIRISDSGHITSQEKKKDGSLKKKSSTQKIFVNFLPSLWTEDGKKLKKMHPQDRIYFINENLKTFFW